MDILLELATVEGAFTHHSVPCDSHGFILQVGVHWEVQRTDPLT